MGEVNAFINLLKATRIIRALIPLSFILLATSFSNTLSTEIIYLMICSTFLYISGGILNAKLDKDYILPKATSAIILILVLITLILSFQNKIIFATVIIWTILSFVYNKHSRKILFADSIVLSFTHAIVPIIATIMLTDLSLEFGIKIISLSFFLMIFLIPMKNLNGVIEDKERKYKTFLTEYQNGKKITAILFNFSILPIIFAFFLFDLNEKYLMMILPILIIYFIINYLLLFEKNIAAYKFSRLIVILFTLAFTCSMSPNTNIIITHTFIFGCYMGYLIFSIKWNTMM